MPEEVATMGGGKGGGSADPSPYEMWMGKIAKELFQETTPMRQNLEGQLMGATQGKMPEAYSPVYGAGKGAIESQYGTARENIIGSTPRGGAQTQALSNLEFARAGDLGDLTANLSQDAYNKAYGVAFQTPQTSLAGMGSAGSTYGARQAALMNSQSNSKAGKAGMLGQFGQGLGTYLAG